MKLYFEHIPLHRQYLCQFFIDNPEGSAFLQSLNRSGRKAHVITDRDVALFAVDMNTFERIHKSNGDDVLEGFGTSRGRRYSISRSAFFPRNMVNPQVEGYRSEGARAERKRYVESMPKKAKQEENAAAEQEQTEPADITIDRLARAKLQATGMSYEDAVNSVLKENLSLAQAYECHCLFENNF